MSQLDDKNLLYPPPSSGNIFLIYPWVFIFKDIFILITNLICRTLVHKYLFNVRDIRNKLNSYFPSINTIFTNSGRSAILLAIRGLGLSAGDEVVLSSFNCSAVIDPIITSNASPILIDCNPNGGIDINKIETVINSHTKAIILTNIYGIMDDIEQIRNLTKGKNIVIINDLSQSLVIPTSNSYFFQNSDICIFSFGQEKHIYCLGGGALYSSDSQFIARTRKLMSSEVTSEWYLYKVMLNRLKYYFTLFIHANLNKRVKILEKQGLIFSFATAKLLSDSDLAEDITIKKSNPIQLFILAYKLKLYRIVSERNLQNYKNIQMAIAFNKRIKILNGLVINPLYLTLSVKENRYDLSRFLSSHSFPSVWNYIPLHLFKRYKKYAVGSFKNSNLLWKRVISVPFRFPMTDKQINKLISYLHAYSK